MAYITVYIVQGQEQKDSQMSFEKCYGNVELCVTYEDIIYELLRNIGSDYSVDYSKKSKESGADFYRVEFESKKALRAYLRSDILREFITEGIAESCIYIGGERYRVTSKKLRLCLPM